MKKTLKVPRIPVDRIKIAVVVLNFLLLAQTVLWLIYDVADRGIGGAWSVWTSGTDGLSATTSFDLGLALLQLAAGWAIVRGARGAGGLLVTSSAITLAFRLPPIWYMLLDSPSDPWFGARTGPSLSAVGASAIFSVVVAAALGALLLLVRHMENEAEALEELSGVGIRPMKVAASASGWLLAVLNVVYVGRNADTVVRTESGIWFERLVGKGSVEAALGVSQSWQWGALTLLCGIGMVLALRRRPAALGFELGLTYFMLPPAFTGLAASISAGTLFATAAGSAQNALELLFSAAVLGLLFREARSIRRRRAASQEPPFLEASSPAANGGRDVESVGVTSSET
jgi:hypothetical protein